MERAHERRVIGYEILRRVAQAEFPGHPINPSRTRGVLGAGDERFLVPVGVDPLELGLIMSPGHYDLLPIDADNGPLWGAAVHLLVTPWQAERQRELLMRSYDALHGRIREADELESSVAEWSSRGQTHPVFGMLRLEVIQAWLALGYGPGPLGEADREALHAEVALRVARRVGARVLR
jgi:hypothetical protein